MGITVLLFCLAKSKPLISQLMLDSNGAFGRCEQSLNDWIVNKAVIGGSNFGGSKKGEEELKVIYSNINYLKPNHVFVVCKNC